MTDYKGVSFEERKKIVDALRARGVGTCPRCSDSQWMVSEYTRIGVQSTIRRNGSEGTTIPAIMIVCEHCGFISHHALQPLGLWNNPREVANVESTRREEPIST